MAITAVRIDDRMIHGQVANLWTPKLGITRIMVIDDAVAENEIEKSGLRLATPSGVKLSVLPIDKATNNINAGKYDSQKVFIIVKHPKVLLDLVDNGVQLKEVNVGNIAAKESRAISITQSIYVKKNDVNIFKSLADAGIKIVAQKVPGEIAQDFMQLLQQKFKY